jgi:Predicted secreted endonuclease distantly related to archaeal Holliday junction resolvase
MPEQTNTLLIILVVANIIAIILLILIRKDSSSKVYNRVLEIEKEKQFIDKIQIAKNRIDKETDEKLVQKISYRKEYLIQDAIKRSTSVSKGKIVEHFAPFMLPDILNPDEIIFIGSPIDLISFTDIDNKDEISIDFLEIKTGNSSLNKKQKLIRDAVFSKRVYFKTVQLK